MLALSDRCVRLLAVCSTAGHGLVLYFLSVKTLNKYEVNSIPQNYGYLWPAPLGLQK